MVDRGSVQRPIASLPISVKLSIPGSPDWVGIGQDAVWISNKAGNSISRIDPATDRIVATVDVGKAPCSGLAVGFGSVWVPSCGGGRLVRVDASSNQVVAEIPTTVGSSEGGVAAGEGGVWRRRIRLGDGDQYSSHPDRPRHEPGRRAIRGNRRRCPSGRTPLGLAVQLLSPGGLAGAAPAVMFSPPVSCDKMRLSVMPEGVTMPARPAWGALHWPRASGTA